MSNLSVRSTLSKCLKQSAPISLIEDVFRVGDIPSPNSLKSALQFIRDFRCPPAAPDAFAINRVGEDSIEFAWSDNADNEDGFEVRWSGTRSFLWWTQRDRGSKKIHTPNLTSGSLTNVRPGFRYCIKVRAFNAGGNSDYSNEECEVVPYPVSEQPEPQPVQGVSEVLFFNRHEDQRAVHLWMRDLTAGSFWEELDDDPLPHGNISPFVVSLPEEHTYLIIAVDPDDPDCDGRNNPTVGNCIKHTTEVLGDPNGSQEVVTIGLGPS